MKQVQMKNFSIGPKNPLALICGPCVIESESHALKTAELLKIALDGLPISLIYKSSYDKANRTSVKSFRGPGLEEGLRILQKVKEQFDLPVLSDVHHEREVHAAAKVCDIIQIPAFLCRQTDLVVAAGKAALPSTSKRGSS